MQFEIWNSQSEDGFCNLEGLENVENEFELEKGVSRGKDFPGNALCRMSASRPKDIRIGDSPHGAQVRIVSKKLRSIIEKEDVRRLEFLPITLINHKGKIASRDYCVLNPLEVLDCIDIEKSNVTWNVFNKSKISYSKGVVLKEDPIPDGIKIFRPKYWESLIVVDGSLIQKFQQAGCTNLFFRPLKGHRV